MSTPPWTRVGRAFLAGCAAIGLTLLCTVDAQGASQPSVDHWSHGGLARPTVVFVDHTGIDWPVGTVAGRWNQAKGVDSQWQVSCPSGGSHCVTVSQYTDSSSPDPVCAGAFGCTFRYAGSTGHLVSSFVIVNDSTVSGAAQHRKVTCHLLGQALGLERQSTSSSCLTLGAAPPVSPYPSQQDLDALRAKYAHDDG